MNEENYFKIINIFTASLGPILAILGTAFLALEWRTNEKRRQNELFDFRYRFYVQLKETYLNQHDLGNRPLDAEDWIPYSEEAGFLFGDDIQKHIMSFVGRKLSGSPDFPEEWFIKPFKKYLQN